MEQNKQRKEEKIKSKKSKNDIEETIEVKSKRLFNLKYKRELTEIEEEKDS